MQPQISQIAQINRYSRIAEGLNMGNENLNTEENNLIWKSGELLVMHVNAKLPDRCIKTNKPANGSRKTVTLNWHPPALYVLIILNFFIYAIVAIIINKKARIEFGVSNEVIKKHNLIRKIGLAVCCLGTVVFFVGLAAMSPFAFLGIAIFIIRIFLTGTLNNSLGKIRVNRWTVYWFLGDDERNL